MYDICHLRFFVPGEKNFLFKLLFLPYVYRSGKQRQWYVKLHSFASYIIQYVYGSD